MTGAGIDDKHPTIVDHHHQAGQAQRLIGTCPTCKVYPIIRYEPGCTFASCDCHEWALPDEDRMGLARLINKTFEPKLNQ